MKVVTSSNSERVARFAFDFAKNNGRKRVTTIHKANIMYVQFLLIISTQLIVLFPGNCQMVYFWKHLVA